MDMNCISKSTWHAVNGRMSLVILISIASTIAGCSGGSSIQGTYPVSGAVSYQGKPVDGATISFIGKGGERPATAISSANGTYDLYTLDTRGALPGNYNVVVTKVEAPSTSVNNAAGFDASGKDLSMEQSAANVGKPNPKAKELLPAKYGSASTTSLTFEVKNSGKNVFDIKLE